MNDMATVENLFGITVIPVEIKGNRWSCIEKQTLPLAPHFRVQVSDQKGFIVYSSLELDTERKMKIEKAIRKVQGNK